MAKARCCRELAAVQPRCRCEALRLFMDGVGELRGCPREAQRAAAAALMAAGECDLRGGSGETAVLLAMARRRRRCASVLRRSEACDIILFSKKKCGDCDM
uniref:Bifunctional inhibitor/plant lipid transfer protein/seed storage helical domain-containing protein n=1 Tax=Oryza rufipogon TaxID=4529 RepID=A0A0E0Q5N7_ORYRU